MNNIAQQNMAGDGRGWAPWCVAGMIVVIATATVTATAFYSIAEVLVDQWNSVQAKLKNTEAKLEDSREEQIAMRSAELKNTKAELEDLREEHKKVLAMKSDLVRTIEQLQLGDQQLSQEASQIISDLRRDLFCHHSYRERIQRMIEQFYRTRTYNRVKEIL